jgi:hypothetical protein
LISCARGRVAINFDESTALAAIFLQMRQLLWGSDRDGSLKKRHAHRTARRQMMVWNTAVSQLANTSRRKLLATVLMYAASLTVRPTSVAGDETKTSTHPTQRIDPMTFVTTKEACRFFTRTGGRSLRSPLSFTTVGH